jgi:tRNA (guanine37-N1)-methyltransferase
MNQPGRTERQVAMTETFPVWTAKVLTLFPGMFPGPLGFSLAGRALDEGAWALDVMNIRGFALDKHATVDAAPFGGGPGMVMRADVIDAALNAAAPKTKPIYLTPRGKPIDQNRIKTLAAQSEITLLCGRFEGVDERVLEEHDCEQLSLGDFVLSGGEPAALALIDACVRLLPGVIGAADSLAEESFEGGLLEYPHYTRPEQWRGRAVPELLLSGHHERIRNWRREAAERITRERRPDLWARHRNHEFAVEE